MKKIILAIVILLILIAGSIINCDRKNNKLEITDFPFTKKVLI